MSKEEFIVFAEKYMDTIYRVAYSWTKNRPMSPARKKHPLKVTSDSL